MPLLRSSALLLALAGLPAALAACSSCPVCASAKPAARYCWVTGLKPEKKAYYEELHAHPWPSVMKTLADCHIHNFSIHEADIGGKTYLVAYLEYTGDDFAVDMKKMGDDPETRRWWKETDPCQSPLPDAAAKGKIWSDTREVFFQK